MARPLASDEDDGVELCPIGLSRLARIRLRRLAEACGELPLALASRLLDDMLADDESAHQIETLN